MHALFSRYRVAMIPVAMLGLVACLEGARSNAQEPKYRTIPIGYKSLDETKPDAAKKKLIIRGAEWDQQLMMKYYVRYLFAGMSNEQGFSNLPKYREEIRKDIASLAENNRQQYNALILTVANEVLKSDRNYHPVLRINTIQILGSLDSKRENRSLPQPFMPAIQKLTQIIGDSQFSLAERVSAMSGLQRHVETYYADAPDQLDDVCKAILAFAIEQDSASNEKVAAFIQTTAAEVFHKHSRCDGVEQFLMSKLTDKNSDFFLRLQCARALQNLDMSKLDPEQSKLAAAHVVHLVMSQSNAWLKRAKGVEDAPEGGATGGFGSGGYGGYGAGGMNPGGSPSGGGGDMSDMYDAYRNGMGGGGGSSGGGNDDRRRSNVRLADTQDADVRIARRMLHQILQFCHEGLMGTPSGPAATTDKGLMVSIEGTDTAPPVRDLIDMIDVVQTALQNDEIKKIDDLVDNLEPEIENLIAVALQVPGVIQIDYPAPKPEAEVASDTDVATNSN